MTNERWWKILGLGLLVWLIPLVARLALVWLEILSRDAYIQLVLLVGVAVVLWALALYLPGVQGNKRGEGLLIGVTWLGMAVVLDVAFLALTEPGFDILYYLANHAWVFLYIPASAVVCGHLAQVVDQATTVRPLRPPRFPIR